MVGPNTIVHISSQLHTVQEEYDPKETKMCKNFFSESRRPGFCWSPTEQDKCCARADFTSILLSTLVKFVNY